MKKNAVGWVAPVGAFVMLSGCGIVPAFTKKDESPPPSQSRAATEPPPARNWAEIINNPGYARRFGSLMSRECDEMLQNAKTELATLAQEKANGSHAVPVELRLNSIRHDLTRLYRTDARPGAVELWRRAEAIRSELPTNAGAADEYYNRRFLFFLAQVEKVRVALKPFITGEVYRRNRTQRILQDRSITIRDLDAALSRLQQALVSYERSLAADLGRAVESKRSRAMLAYAQALALKTRPKIVRYEQKLMEFAKAFRKDAVCKRLIRQKKALAEKVRREERIIHVSAGQCSRPSRRRSFMNKLCNMWSRYNRLVSKLNDREERIRARIFATQ